jgi:peptidoglycan/LPS O-acetylase OafA/YrhL
MLLNNKNYRPDIDGLRAVAVLAVVSFHAFPAYMPGGFIGVDIFFVISGYLISGIIFSELADEKFSFGLFYRRRICRIFPALLLVLLACGVAGWFLLLADEYAQLSKHIAASAGFMQNLILWYESGYFDQATDLKPLLHLWSLGIEEQFYIFWPVILWALWKNKLNSVLVAALLLVTSFALCLVATQTSLTAAFYSPFTRFWEFLFGSLLAWHALTRHPADTQLVPALRVQVLSVLGVVLIAAALLVLNRDRDFPGAWALLPVVGTSLIIYAGPRAFVNRFFLASRWMVLVGLISYPLYLWHWPLLSFGRILVNQPLGVESRLLLLSASVVLAWLTYRLLEQPIRTRFFKKNFVTGLLAILMVVAGGMGYWIYQQGGIASRAVVQGSGMNLEILSIELPAQTPCVTQPSLTQGVAPRALLLCTLYSAPNPQKTILLWGDSTVISWLPVFLTVAKQNNYTVVAITHPSCPPILRARKTTFTYEQSKAYCSDGETQAEILTLIKNSQPDLIVWMAAWSSYANKEFITDANSAAASQATTRQTLMTQFPETQRQLAEIGKLVVFKDWPIMPSKPTMRAIDLFGFKQAPVFLSRAQFNRDTEFMDRLFAANQPKNSSYFDPSYKVCDESLCFAAREGVLFYEDTYHLSSQGAMRFKGDIETMFRDSSTR